MGGVQSANDGRETQTSDRESSHMSNHTPPSVPVPDSVAALKTDVELHDATIPPQEQDDPEPVGDDAQRSAHDSDAAADSDDSMTEKCQARKMTVELANFRRDLQQKRQLHQSKLVAVKDELEHLRKALAEEKRRNRALIKYVQQQELQLTKQANDGEGAEETPACGAVRREALQIVASGENAPLEPAERVNAEAAEHERHDQSSSAGGQSVERADDDERLALKRELAESQHALQCTTGELLELRHELAQLRTQLRAQQDEAEAESSRQCGAARTLKAELAETQFRLQISQAEALSLQTDVDQLRNQVKSLKDVIKAGKEIIAIREDQVEQLKGKLRQIEDTLQERELQIMSDDLRREYDRQLTNIRNLRDLYEERERVSRMERDNLVRQLDLKKNELATEQEKNKNLEALVESLQTDLTRLRTELEQTQDRLGQSQAESKQLQLEMGVVNQFISKFLLGMSRKPTASDINIDKLAAVLEENRDLLIEMTKDEAETIDTGAFLPRALYDLITEVDEANELPPGNDGKEEDGAEASGEDEFTDVQKASPEQIADKLPKVWRVLIELVNHQERAQPVPFVEGGESEECLKSVQTRNGPKTVVSVSKTYIKLKDLILEKKSLKKETNRLRTLNSHLERRLDSQEKRLSAVSLELTKTWHLVGKMQRQHRQLHTQEQILRYHLQQKRRLLSELKEELEYCRLKWSAAREKNIESEGQWKSLKADFAARRKQDSLNNSGESGYSDEQPSDEEDTHVNRKSSLANQQSPGFSGGAAAGLESDKWSQMVGRLDKCFVGSSLSNIYHLAVASVLRKVHSESDMKSLENVERANQFCNEKIEDLPIFPFEEDEPGREEPEEIPAVMRKKRRSASKKGKKRHNDAGQPESAQDMFLRLMNLAAGGQDEVDEDEEDDDADEQDFERTGTGNDDAEGEYSENESASELSEEELECLEMAVMDERAESSVTQERLQGPDASSHSDADRELSSEELFQRKREARLQRMAEINSRLDRYSSPTPTASPSEAPVQTESGETGETSQSKTDEQVVLSEDEQKYLQRRAERLERLEREAKEFRSRLSKTVHRGTEISAQIDEIHNGFMARQTDSSPVPGCSGEAQSSRVDLSCLTDKEREYTSARAERLERLENESQKLLKQMNQTMRRGSSLTTKLDMLHTRYGSPAANEPEANVETSARPEQQTANGDEVGPEETSKPDPAVEMQETVPQEQEEQDYAVGGPYVPMGPIELVLVSDEEVMDEVSNLLEGETQHSLEDSNESPEQS
uniref:Janus kinase and microtubule-interacting protein C-terminal domain-containing protein n=1 Tax=Anopheles coluzzii TaxID=1518534 RepID=A0A6E8VTK6_ANOCL|nr:restin homolog [Anopheles coluzzii]XP_049464488.1 restin homolog [Anopheles coluzzii]